MKSHLLDALRLGGICVALLLHLGCGRDAIDSPAADASETASIVEWPNDPDTQQVDKMLVAMDSANNETEKYTAAWEFVLRSMDGKDTEISQQGAAPPIAMQMNLGATAFDWSEATARRQIAPGHYPGTAQFELATFVYSIPWGPTKDALGVWTTTEKHSGKTDLLEWQLSDDSTDTEQRLKLRFRLAPLPAE